VFLQKFRMCVAALSLNLRRQPPGFDNVFDVSAFEYEEATVVLIQADSFYSRCVRAIPLLINAACAV